MFDISQVTKCLEHIPWHQEVSRKENLILQFSVALELQLNNFVMFYKFFHEKIYWTFGYHQGWIPAKTTKQHWHCSEL